MKNLMPATFLTIAVLMGGAGTSWGADFQKGMVAFNKGDFTTALNELRPLAEQGNVEAQYRLGWMFRHGKGVIQDIVFAHMWWNIAASHGHPIAGGGRDMVADEMTSLEKREAQLLARKCVQKKYKDC